MFKLAFWVALIGGGVFVGGQVIPVYYTNLKIQNIFEGVAQSMPNRSEAEVTRRIHELFQIQTVDLKSLPPEFLENMSVKKESGKLLVQSKYHVTLWLLDKPASVNPDEEYKASDVKGMDKLKLKTRLDFDFVPSAKTP